MGGVGALLGRALQRARVGVEDDDLAARRREPPRHVAAHAADADKPESSV
jgi:hypothetical protein